MLLGHFILLHVLVSDPWCSDIVMGLRDLILGVKLYLEYPTCWTRTSVRHQYPSPSNIGLQVQGLEEKGGDREQKEKEGTGKDSMVPIPYL